METKEILHMSKGDGEFSYSRNTINHKGFSKVIKPVLERAIRRLMQTESIRRPCITLNMADLGCGVGPSPMTFISTIVESVHKICDELKLSDCEMPEVQIYMSDLPSNDFNLLFKDVSQLIRHDGVKQNGKPVYFVMGVPGSFYGRLFPSNSIHLVHSYYAIHWLSQVPRGLWDEEGKQINKGAIRASGSSFQAYCEQFQQDFEMFLNCRSHEVIKNGVMVLSTCCRPCIEPWEPLLLNFLFLALHRLVSKGVIEEEKVDSFNMPSYLTCKEEIQEIVTKEGSFAIEQLEVVLLNDDQWGVTDAEVRAESKAKITRSFTEALVSDHFGLQVWNELYDLLYQANLEHFESNPGPYEEYNIVLYLTKL